MSSLSRGGVEAPKRSLALDFFRGLAMLVIVVDHIGGSIVSRGTLHAFAFPDAAEAFVFLSGYALAGAWSNWTARGARDITGRLLRRAWTVYQAFLLTAALMLLVAEVFRHVGVIAPNLPLDALERFGDSPSTYLIDLLMLREQPYLSSVLPMYLLFLLAAPTVVPFALRRPLWALTVSALVWYLAPEIVGALPGIANNKDAWSFNPFAWQWMFVIGIVGQSAWLRRLFVMPRWRFGLAVPAALITIACAIWRLGFGPAYLPPEWKLNLEILRVVNFVAIAWLLAIVGQTGWFDRNRLGVHMVAAVGRLSLPVFIAGAVISLTLDSILFNATGGRLDYPAGLLIDLLALSATVVFALALRHWRLRSVPGFRPRPQGN